MFGHTQAFKKKNASRTTAYKLTEISLSMMLSVEVQIFFKKGTHSHSYIWLQKEHVIAYPNVWGKFTGSQSDWTHHLAWSYDSTWRTQGQQCGLVLCVTSVSHCRDRSRLPHFFHIQNCISKSGVLGPRSYCPFISEEWILYFLSRVRFWFRALSFFSCPFDDSVLTI